MKRAIYSLFFLILLATPVCGQTKADADSAYAKGNYPYATSLYEQILKKGDNASIYYNLGNAYYRQHDLAHAILNYERAAMREPGDADVRFNLALARSKTIDKIAGSDSFFIVYWIHSLINCLNTDEWSILSIAVFFLFVVSVLSLRFGRTNRWKKVSLGCGATMLFLVIIFNVFAYVQREQYLDNTHAIIMTTASVKSTPDISGTVLFVLHEGTKVKIIDDSMKKWKEVSLADGKTGWIEQKDMELI